MMGVEMQRRQWLGVADATSCYGKSTEQLWEFVETARRIRGCTPKQAVPMQFADSTSIYSVLSILQVYHLLKSKNLDM